MDTQARDTDAVPADVVEDDAEEYVRQKTWRESQLVGPIGAFLLAIVLYALWQVASSFNWVGDVILPAPWAVVKALYNTLSEGFFYSHLWITTQEVLIGFFFGVVIGFGLGALLGISRLARSVAYPYIVAFQGLPKIVLAPIFITAFGFGMSSKVVMATVISFFPLLVNTESGIATVDQDAVKLMRSLNASKRDIFFRLALPHALPSIFAGLKTALTFALVGAIVGEFVGAGRGLGYLLDTYSYQLQVPRVWAITAVLALMGVILFVVIDTLDKKIVFWRKRGSDVEATM